MKTPHFFTTLRGLFSDANQLKRIVLFAGLALLLATISFGSYYYRDRYIHFGDQSPVEKSIQELEDAVRQHPQDVEFRLALAESYMVEGRYDDAAKQAMQVLNAYPENERARFIVGVSQATLENWDQAIGPLEAFVSIRSKLSTAGMDKSLETALYFLGKSYLETGRSDDAIQSLLQAVQINSTDADAFYLLGVAYARMDQHEMAIRNYEEVVRFVPNYLEAYQGMVESYTALEKPDYADYARGMVTFSLKDFEIARLELEKASTGLSDFAPVFIGLGLTYEELGDLQSAKANLEHALQIAPDNFTASQAFARVEAKMQK